ncbi:hypothetical protein Tco_0093183 [Tanacetum coccineum]
MQEELLQFKLQKVWTLVDLSNAKRVDISSKEEALIIDKVFFCSVARIEAISLVDEAPLSIYLIENGFRRGTIDKTLFIKKDKASTPIEPNKALVKDEEADNVDVHLYRSMIGSLMYLTASRHDIMFAVCTCARDSPFDLEAFLDSDYVGASLDRKSTIGGCQFLGKRLISWLSYWNLFWQIASTRTLEDEEVKITATIDGQLKTITEASLRRHLKLEDADVFEQLALMGYASDSDKLTFQKGLIQQGEGSTVPGTYTTHDSPLPEGYTLGSDEGSMTLNELTVLCTQLSTKVASLEQDLKQTKKVYGNAYTKLIMRVKKLEHKVKSRQPRRRARVVISDTEEDLEDPSKQGRRIAEIDQNPSISLVQDEGTSWIQEDAEIQGRTSADTEILLDQEEPTELVERSDNAKKQKLEDDAEKEELRDSMDVVPRDDIAIHVESLATKYLIVDRKIHVLTENMMYYQIIKADGSSKNYKIFSEMLDDFDRQDVMDLHRLVQERYDTTSPKGYDLLYFREI